MMTLVTEQARWHAGADDRSRARTIAEFVDRHVVIRITGDGRTVKYPVKIVGVAPYNGTYRVFMDSGSDDSGPDIWWTYAHMVEEITARP